MRLLACALIALLALAAPAAEAAPAKKTRKKAIWGPTQVNGHSAFPVYRDLGVGIWQVLIHWDDVARRRPAHAKNPRDRAYRWPKYVGDGVREARRYGIKVNIAVMGAPRWANGGRDWMYAPKRARDYANFMAAASRRYRYVSHWMVWIEPTRHDNFRPLIPERRNRPLTKRQRRAPQRYAQLLDSAYGALKRVDRKDKVIGGNTFVTGDISPYNWVRYMRLPGGRRARMDMWGHNPFGFRKPRLADRPLGNGFVDFGTLDTFARRIDRYQRRGMKLFLSEYTIPTDHSNHEFNFYATKKTQADFAKAALRISRRWRRIYTFGWFSLTDEPPRPKGDENNRGLMTYQGRKKPSYAAFKRN
jgi:hypothetical protein